jgi:HAD superfamily hydrolase (TIGR01509 family)
MPALLMDLDGTLADTLPHLFAAFRYGLEPFVKRPPTEAAIVATFGPPERDCLLQLLYEDAGHTVVMEDVDRAHQRFLDYYSRPADLRLFPGAAELVPWVRERGWRFGVFTGKARASAEYTLEHLGLSPYVEVLVSGTDVQKPKPDPEGVLQASRLLGVPPRAMLVVGDTAADVAAGKGARAWTGAALWGAFDPAGLRAARPTWELAAVADLRRVIEEWGGGA